MIEKLRGIGDQALKEIGSASGLEALERVRISILGKKGALSEVLKGLGSVAPTERPVIGGVANELKKKIEEALEERKQGLERALLQEKIRSERIDITAPARLAHRGSSHLVTQVTQRIIQIFS